VLSSRDVPGPTPRAAVAAALLSSWLVLLMTGWSGGGATHVLLLLSLVAFPWRRAAGTPHGIEHLTRHEEEEP